jgi:phenylalanyl-tRNA synthetase beta chain
MKFSYNWLKELIGKKTPKPEKLAELLTLYSFEVEQVEKVGSDFRLDIDILPNRGPDCFSHIGIARESAAILNLKKKFPAPLLKEDKRLKAKDLFSIEVKNKKDCSRYTARVFTNVKVSSSPEWMKKRLKICGLRPINNIVDIANYVMLETGQPLHAFDGNKISEGKIIVRRAKKREKITTLDNEKYTLNRDILIIADKKGPLGVAGIKGGKRAEIDKKTKLVVLESANFNSKVIRQGSKKLKLKTDASWRFEHGIDPNLTEMALARAGFLIHKLASAKTTQGLLDFYPQKVKTKRIRLNLIYIRQLLGKKINTKEVKSILTKLEFKILQDKHPNLLVETPTFRLDVNIPEDLIEEVGRMVGLQKIPSIFPLVALIPPRKNINIFWERFTKNILKEAGFSETYNHSFVSKDELRAFGYKTSKSIELENPVSLDYQYLRPSLMPNLLKNIKENEKNFKDIRIFELGKIFQITGSLKKRPKYEEKNILLGIMTGNVFFQAKGVIDLLLTKMGISNIWYDDHLPTPEESNISLWHPKACAEVKIENEEIGFLGEISPDLLRKLKIKGKLVALNLDFEKLKRLASAEHEYIPISPYPAAIRDISVLVPRETKVIEVLNKINLSGGSLIRDIDLFDIYEGEEIARGKKNLAFHLIYQAEDHTLSAKEIDKIQKTIINSLEENPDWKVRV